MSSHYLYAQLYYLSKLHVPVSGISLREFSGPEPFWDIPVANVGALWLVVQKVILLPILLHLFHLVRSQFHQSVHLSREPIRTFGPV